MDVDSTDHLQRGVVSRAAVHEVVAAEEPENGAKASIQQVLQEDRLAGHGSANARLQECKAGVHEPRINNFGTSPSRLREDSTAADTYIPPDT